MSEKVSCNVSSIYRDEDGGGPVESSDLYVRGRGISLLINVPAGSTLTYCLSVDGTIQNSGLIHGAVRTEGEK